MSKPSILLINRTYPPVRGATGRLLRDLAYALAQKDWQVTILTAADSATLEFLSQGKDTAEDGDVAREKIAQNIKIKYVKCPRNYKSAPFYLSLWLRIFFAALFMKRHDVVLTMTDPPLTVVIGRFVALLKKSKHVHWCHDIYPDLFKPLGVRLPKFLKRYLAGLSHRSLKSCDKIVVLGRCMVQRIMDKGIPMDNIALIANWADFEIIAPSGKKSKGTGEMDLTSIAKKPEEMFRDDSPKFRILYAGNIGRAHTMRSIIEAAAILSKHSEIEFVFIGDQHAHSILARERTKRGLENIKFMPYQPIERLKEVMESGDIHLVSMRNEVKGLLVPCKFYSGLAVGRPTVFIGPEDSEISHIIEEYGAGKVVPVGKAKALAKAIYDYRTDGEDWFQGQEGALRAAQAYHPSQSLHKWLDLLDQVRL